MRHNNEHTTTLPDFIYTIVFFFNSIEHDRRYRYLAKKGLTGETVLTLEVVEAVPAPVSFTIPPRTLELIWWWDLHFLNMFHSCQIAFPVHQTWAASSRLGCFHCKYHQQVNIFFFFLPSHFEASIFCDVLQLHKLENTNWFMWQLLDSSWRVVTMEP